jgi:ABC-type Na+ efflux pump permease subunit
MELFFSLWFWIGVIAVTGIIAGVITNAVNKKSETAKHVADSQAGGDYRALAEQSLEASRALLERISAVEQRLASVEKTLTDIPQ